MSSDGSQSNLDPSASASMSAPDAMIGQVLDGRYRIVAKLGEGGMGEVYAAEHEHIEKKVAIKLLRNEIVQNQEAVSRFRQEARSASSIGHKNIAGIEDFGILEDGRLYLCMELLSGEPLNELIEQPMDPGRLLNILIQCGHGLAAAHAKNIVHRDMKPENIFVTTDTGQDIPKLLDFGIAKVSQSEGNNHLTKTGTIFGTPFYMAPEQALGQQVDQRADIYAMGVIMYECFCGAVPFQGESFMAILTQHITSEPMPPAQMAAQNGRALPQGIEQVIVKAMKKEPEDRYQSMDELVQALVTLYRGIAGAGMSSYMQAYVPPPTAGHQAATMGAPMSSSYPSQPSHGMAPTPTPMPMQMHVGDSSSFDMPARKSRAGVFIAIFAVLAVLGGGAAFLILSGGKDDKKGDEVAANGAGDTQDPGTTDPKDPGTTDPGTTDPKDPGTTDPKDPGTTDPTAAGTTDPKDPGTTDPKDPGTTEWGTPKDPKDPGTTDPVPAVKPIHVLLNSKPQGAVVYVGGKKLDAKTPTLVEVIPGEPVDVKLERSGYKDTSITLDGKKKKVTASMSRDRKPDPKKDPKTDPKKDPEKDPKKDPKWDPNKMEDGVLGED